MRKQGMRAETRMRAYENTYACMQLINICVLYEYLDYDKKTVAAITEKFLKLDEEERKSSSLCERMDAALRERFGADGGQFARMLTAQQKYRLAVVPKSMHNQEYIRVLLLCVERSAHIYFTIMATVLAERPEFSADDMRRYLTGCRQVLQLVGRGMDRKWIERYIAQEIGWEVEHCEKAGTDKCV